MRHIFAVRQCRRVRSACASRPGGCSGNAGRRHAARGAGLNAGAVSATVDLAAIATAADQALDAATSTQKRVGLTQHRHARSRRHHVDERHDCQDNVPACVPSTVWGTASRRNSQVGLGAVRAAQCGTLPCHRPRRQAEHAIQGANAPDDTPLPVQQLRTCSSGSASLRAGITSRSGSARRKSAGSQ